MTAKAAKGAPVPETSVPPARYPAMAQTKRKANRKTAKGVRKAKTRKAKKPRKTKKTRKWSGRVTRESDALDLKQGVFTAKDPKTIARSLKRSAEASHRRKSSPYRSAMSMLTFYINRGGKDLPARQRAVLEKAKDELRALFHRD